MLGKGSPPSAATRRTQSWSERQKTTSPPQRRRNGRVRSRPLPEKADRSGQSESTMKGMKAVLPSSSRNEQVNRILAIVRDLHRTGGMDIYEIAEKYGTVTRTVRRDLECIQSIGIPLVE